MDVDVSVAGIQKNRCRTTVAEPIAANAGGTALYRGSGRLLKPRPGRPKRTYSPSPRLLMRRFIEAVPPQGFMQRCFVTATLALGGGGGRRSRGRPGRRRDRGRRGRATRLPVPPCPIETPW